LCCNISIFKGNVLCSIRASTDLSVFFLFFFG
jgi:hypothetical protein